MKKLIFFSLFFVYSFVAYAQNAVHTFLPAPQGEFGLTISPDGTHALWVQSNGGRDTLQILEAFKENGQCSKPQVVSFSGNVAWRDIDPVFSPDGKTLYFQSNRPVADQPNRKGFDIWEVKKVGKTWSAPRHLGNVLNTDISESFASVAENGNMYFMKENENKVGRSDIYVSRFVNGAYQTPENIGLPINTNERESNPFISPKEDYIIYFSSDTKDPEDADVDLMISFKKGNQWTAPLSLGEPINSEAGEFCPFVHYKKNHLYFSRSVQLQNGRRQETLYYYTGIKELIKKLKKKAFSAYSLSAGKK